MLVLRPHTSHILPALLKIQVRNNKNSIAYTGKGFDCCSNLSKLISNNSNFDRPSHEALKTVMNRRGQLQVAFIGMEHKKRMTLWGKMSATAISHHKAMQMKFSIENTTFCCTGKALLHCLVPKMLNLSRAAKVNNPATSQRHFSTNYDSQAKTEADPRDRMRGMCKAVRMNNNICSIMAELAHRQVLEALRITSPKAEWTQHRTT